MDSHDLILEARQISKSFKGLAAVSNVDLAIRKGSTHALIGPNGAGKTTLFNLLTRFLSLSNGQIFYDGRDITSMSPAQVARRGLVRSFQISAIFPQLTVRENVRVALQRKRGESFDFWRSGKALERYDAAADSFIEMVGLQDLADTRAVNLSYGRKRVLELATTLALEPKLMLLDEPIAGMGHEDIERVSELIRRMSRSCTILMVEHNLSVVASLCDRITVLARGKVVAEGAYREIADNPLVIEAYIGASDG